ncbi:MAG: lariat debranching enzyme, partial [Paramarteilia canceri]
MRVAIAGCVHGNFKLLSDEINRIEEENGKLDLILLCGDLQTPRTGNSDDIESMKLKSSHMWPGEFHMVESGELKFPCPIIATGGNHEAYNFLSQLPYGGYIEENFFYGGRSSLLTFK